MDMYGNAASKRISSHTNELTHVQCGVQCDEGLLFYMQEN